MSHVTRWMIYLPPKSQRFKKHQNSITKIYMYYIFGQVCVTNWAALFYYKLGETLLQIGAASLLQIRASVVTNWGN